jgi:hypothetical protein
MRADGSPAGDAVASVMALTSSSCESTASAHHAENWAIGSVRAAASVSALLA